MEYDGFNKSNINSLNMNHLVWEDDKLDDAVTPLNQKHIDRILLIALKDEVRLLLQIAHYSKDDITVDVVHKWLQVFYVVLGQFVCERSISILIITSNILKDAWNIVFNIFKARGTVKFLAENYFK